MSIAAWGMYQYLAHRPPEDATLVHLEQAFRNGRPALDAALQELERLGLARRHDPGPWRCAVCGGVRQGESGQHTYIARRAQWVKIGRSRHIEQRIKTLTRESKPSVLCPDGMVPGTPVELVYAYNRDIEHDLHERFAEHHVVGEWFTAEPVMAALA
jgi:hypothetical protein